MFLHKNAGEEIAFTAVLTETVPLIMLCVNTLQKAGGINSREVKKNTWGLVQVPSS